MILDGRRRKKPGKHGGHPCLHYPPSSSICVCPDISRRVRNPNMVISGSAGSSTEEVGGGLAGFCGCLACELRVPCCQTRRCPCWQHDSRTTAGSAGRTRSANDLATNPDIPSAVFLRIFSHLFARAKSVNHSTPNHSEVAIKSPNAPLLSFVEHFGGGRGGKGQALLPSPLL